MFKTKIWLICIGVGLVLIMVGAGMGGSRTIYIDRQGIHAESTASLFNSISGYFTTSNDSENGDFVTLSEENMREFDSVDISMIDMPVTLEPADYYSLEIYYPSERDIEWDNRNGRLTVSDKTNSGDGGRIYLFGGNTSFMGGGYVNVYAPADELDKIKIENVSGDLYVGAFDADDLTLRTVSGTLEADGVEAERISAENVSGGIWLNVVDCETINAKSVSGGIGISVDIDADDCALQLESISGSITVDGERVGKMFETYTVGKKSSSDCYIEAGSVSGGIEINFD